MALHESKKISTSDIIHYSPNPHPTSFRIDIDEDGLYQIVFGGLSSASGGSYMNLYYNSWASPDSVIDSVFCPQDSTSSDFGMKISKFYLHKDDYLSIYNPDISEDFIVFELIG